MRKFFGYMLVALIGFGAAFLIRDKENILSYQHDLDKQISNGYVYTVTMYNEDKQYTELLYSGPSISNPEVDTTFVISVFNNVEMLFNPKTGNYSFESYTVD